MSSLIDRDMLEHVTIVDGTCDKCGEHLPCLEVVSPYEEDLINECLCVEATLCLSCISEMFTQHFGNKGR